MNTGIGARICRHAMQSRQPADSVRGHASRSRDPLVHRQEVHLTQPSPRQQIRGDV
jgi:hypothetical protein